MSRLYILDTNHASHLIRNRSGILRKRICHTAEATIAISVITEAELRYGVKKRPEALHLAAAVEVFLRKVKILPWTSEIAMAYAGLRADCEVKGKSLGSMDMLIAAHALSLDAILLTSDKAFLSIAYLRLEDWTTE